MPLDDKFKPLAREYVGLLMTDKSTREEIARFPDHETEPEEYHTKLCNFVNQRLHPQTPLPQQAAGDFHRFVSDGLEDFRSNLHAHTASESEYVLAADGFEGEKCV